MIVKIFGVLFLIGILFNRLSERLEFLRGFLATVFLALDRSDGRVDPLFLM